MGCGDSKLLSEAMNNMAKAKTRAGPAFGTGGTTPSSDFDKQAGEVLKGEVYMFSGCKDSQTSADVGNVASFGLPTVSATEKAGGACTNALLSTLKKTPQISYGDLLIQMQATLKERKYTQVPQLSSAHQVKLKETQFSIWNGKPRQGRTKALLIGINYVGQNGELAGCVNDVKMMRRFLDEQGFSGAKDRMRVLTDDQDRPTSGDGQPTGQNIIKGMEWLLQDARPGDSLFLHYSGHGGQAKDDANDEEDGMDETLIPSDYQKSGQIRDDTVFKMLVAPLKKDVQLVCVFDCCHSGTILDLPYMFYGDEAGCQALASGEQTGMQTNPGFNFGFALQMLQQVAGGMFKGNSEMGRTAKSVLGMLGKVAGKK